MAEDLHDRRVTSGDNRMSVEEYLSSPAMTALRQAVAKAIKLHHQLGHPVAVGRNGQVFWIYPDGHEEPDDST